MKTLYIFFFSVTIIGAVSAQNLHVLSYQGLLTDASDNPKADGDYSVTFSFYAGETGGDAVWSETKTLAVAKGLFSTSLGDQIPFGAEVKFDKPLWLGIKVGDETELTPRIRLSSSGYSFSSIYADTANNIVEGKVVKSLMGLRDDVVIEGEGGTTVNADGNKIKISSSGSGGTGIQGVQNSNSTIDVTNPNGPTATVNVKVPLAINGSGEYYTLRGYNTGKGGGIWGESWNPNGSGVVGYNTSGGWGVYGNSPNGAGVVGTSSVWTGVYGETGTWFGLWGKATGENGKGVLGESATSFGVWGVSPNSAGVVGESDNWVGVYGESEAGNGVWGKSITANGVYGESSLSGVYGKGGYAGVNGENVSSGYGVVGISAAGTGIYAETKSTTGVGIFAINSSSGSFGVIGGWSDLNPNYAYRFGVYGNPGTGSDDTRWVGIYGKANSPNQRAGLFDGSVDVLGKLNAAGSKNFKIDNPTDPANKYLYHASVESPERLNVYNGNIVTDSDGLAVINLPHYFELLNVDYHYQLTVIGQFSQAIVESEIKNNSFTIRTDKPNVKVSWQVTGVRNDPYAKTHPMVVEEEKEEYAKGKYLMPELYGQPEEKGIYYQKGPEISKNENRNNNNNQ